MNRGEIAKRIGITPSYLSAVAGGKKDPGRQLERTVDFLIEILTFSNPKLVFTSLNVAKNTETEVTAVLKSHGIPVGLFVKECIEGHNAPAISTLLARKAVGLLPTADAPKSEALKAPIGLPSGGDAPPTKPGRGKKARDGAE